MKQKVQSFKDMILEEHEMFGRYDDAREDSND
jgi:hypothetical protein